MRRRADLTFKQNRQHGRHGWLRLTPAYSVKVVDDVLAAYGAGATRVLEPFNGTGTTPLCAAYAGKSAVGVDINPFLIWLGRTKAAVYAATVRADLEEAGAAVVADAGATRDPSPPPPLSHIERWWDADALWALRALRDGVEAVDDPPIRDLLRIAFCRTMIRSSNAAFNHQSMSFKSARSDGPPQPAVDVAGAVQRLGAWFAEDVAIVAESAPDAPTGVATFARDDSRLLSSPEVVAGGPYDLLITSPPYPNRMSYIRELRPYMYWLGHLHEAREAGELDWEAIGGTWGTATSKLLTWARSTPYVPEYLGPITEQIEAAHPKNGVLMAQYVRKYFEDMSAHLHRAYALLTPGGTAHYIIGNSTFYGHVVPAERLYADLMAHAGFTAVEVVALRKRNSKKELVEFRVSATRG